MYTFIPADAVFHISICWCYNIDSKGKVCTVNFSFPAAKQKTLVLLMFGKYKKRVDILYFGGGSEGGKIF